MAARHGGPDVLEVIEEEVPEPGPGEVRVKLLAAGVAFGDIMWQTGKVPGSPKPPYTPGYDLVGTVDRLGPGTTGFDEGQRVMGLINYGGYAEHVCAPSDKLVAVPDDLDPSILACLPLNYLTAYQLFRRVGKLERGKRVLVHGAAGGLGSAALDVGRLLELEMYGTASAPKHELVTSLGATAIDYRSEDFVERINDLTGNGVDLVIDHIGGAHLARSFATLRPGGRLIMTSSYASVRGEQSTAQALLGMLRVGLWNALPNRRSAQLFDIVALNKKHPEWYREDLLALTGFLAEGKLKPVIAERFPLDQARQAQERVLAAEARGKVILIPQLGA
ncbi:MAG: zinc-binding dehydrogenase [Trueperaceae bacterium]|nr:MAG: zinc-binding dehydrogenase [Trueperaceae bacterium]